MVAASSAQHESGVGGDRRGCPAVASCRHPQGPSPADSHHQYESINRTAASKSHRTNNSRRNGSDIDDTIAVIVVALGQAVAALVWLSVLFLMISIPTIASVWIGLCYGPVFGLPSRRCPAWPWLRGGNFLPPHSISG
jgi:hypothetical protein